MTFLLRLFGSLHLRTNGRLPRPVTRSLKMIASLKYAFSLFFLRSKYHKFTVVRFLILKGILDSVTKKDNCSVFVTPVGCAFYRSKNCGILILSQSHLWDTYFIAVAPVGILTTTHSHLCGPFYRSNFKDLQRFRTSLSAVLFSLFYPLPVPYLLILLLI